MIRAIVVPLVASLVGAGAAAPFLHVHVDDHTAAHHGRTMHVHAAHHVAHVEDCGGCDIGDDDSERPVDVPLFTANSEAAAQVPAVEATTTPFEAPLGSRCVVRPQVVHSHGPPLRGPDSLRAPPVPLLA